MTANVTEAANILHRHVWVLDMATLTGLGTLMNVLQPWFNKNNDTYSLATSTMHAACILTNLH